MMRLRLNIMAATLLATSMGADASSRSGVTNMTFSASHGTQVEYMSADGRSFLWYPGIELARQYGRYGYRKIAALLRDAGWRNLQEAPRGEAVWSCRWRLVNDKRVERIWRCEGLKVPAKQPPLATPSSFA